MNRSQKELDEQNRSLEQFISGINRVQDEYESLKYKGSIHHDNRN